MPLPCLAKWWCGGRRTLALLGLAATTASAAPGDIDTRFGVGGFIGLRPAEGTSWSPVVGLAGRLHQLESSPGTCGPENCVAYRLVSWSVDGHDRTPSAVPLEPLASGSYSGRVQRLANGDLLLPIADPSYTIGVRRLDPSGAPRQEFGTDGTAWTTWYAQSVPGNRAMATQIVAVAEPPAGGLLALHALNCQGGTLPANGGPPEGAYTQENWGVPLQWHPCEDTSDWEGMVSLARLRSDGSQDPSFGSGGPVSIREMGPLGLLAVRSDASIVIAGRNGSIRVLEPDGAARHSVRLDLSDMTGLSMADGSLWLVGTRRPHELWVARLNADLTPDTLVGNGTGQERLDLSAVRPGSTDLDAWPMEAVADQQGNGILVSTNLATRDDRAWLCAGVLRISLATPRPVADNGFGRGGFACVTRTGLDYRRSRLAMAQDGSVILSLPDQHLLERPQNGLQTVRLRTDLAAQGAGLVSVQGMSSILAGNSLALAVGRSSGSSGGVGVRWRAIAVRYFIELGLFDASDRVRAQSVGTGREGSVEIVTPPEILAEGRIEWPSGSSDDAQIQLSLPASVRSANSERCALRGIHIVLDDPSGGVAYSRSIHRVSVPLPAGSSPCLVQTGAAGAPGDNGGGGKLGASAVLALLALARARRRRATTPASC